MTQENSYITKSQLTVWSLCDSVSSVSLFTIIWSWRTWTDVWMMKVLQ